MTVPPPPDGYLNDPADESQDRNKRADRATSDAPSIRDAEPEVQRTAVGIDMAVTGAVPLLVFDRGWLWVLLLTIANSVVLQGLTGQSLGKVVTRTKLVMTAADTLQDVWQGKTFLAFIGVRRAGERLLLNIVTFPMVLFPTSQWTSWRCPADALMGFYVMRGPIRLRRVGEMSVIRPDYDLSPWDRHRRDKAFARQYHSETGAVLLPYRFFRHQLFPDLRTLWRYRLDD